MSRLEELIQQLCPNGVEFKPLEEVFELKNGYTPSKAVPEYWVNGTIPWFRMEDIRQNGRILSDSIQHITPEAVKGGRFFPANSIILATTATIGEHALIIADSLANQQFTNLKIRKSLSNKMDMKFFFYYMFIIDEWCKKNVHNGGFASVDMDKLKKLEIPLPPIPVQEEIVRILDTFTESTNNLKEQIQTRRKQYEYYRDQLLSLEGKEGYNIIPMKDLGTLTRGKRFVRDDVRETGQPCIHYGDLYTHYGIIADKAKTYLDRDFPKKMRYAKKGDVVIVGAGENDWDIGIGMVWNGEEPAVVHDACYILQHQMNSKYISYYLRSACYHLQIKKYVSTGKICSISAEGIGKALISVPSLAEQQRIVDILDQFEASIANLEAQLKQREKQYEYYRNLLLDFKMKKS